MPTVDSDLRPGAGRIALLVPPGPGWLAAAGRILTAGDAVVPLAPTLPAPEIEHALREADVGAVVVDAALADRVRGPAGARAVPVRIAARDDGHALPDPASLPPECPALVLFTSGTTGRPKAVVHTAGSLAAQVRILRKAWAWSAEDRILSVLPLHHAHGVVNVVFSARCADAGIEFLRFGAEAVWARLAAGGITLLMAVPTMYARLVRAFRDADAGTRRRWAAGAARLRLFVSGSAALPEPLFLAFEEITGHRILERYGMTEFGMALGNPLDGERRPGSVGVPFPEVSIRLADGEIEVRSPGMFVGYHGRPEPTRAAFRDGWFRTGDQAVVEDGYWRILGRSSVDIVKTGGEKVSALEVESVLLSHPDVCECAVVGVPDPEWGERVVAVVVPAGARAPGLEDLRAFARDRLAPFKLPREVRIVAALPRNALGKVVKTGLRGGGVERAD